MALSFRILRSGPGRNAAVFDGLRQYASRLVRDEGTSVLVCRTDDPDEFLWIEQRTAAARPALGWRDLADAVAAPLLEARPAVSLRFVGAWHRLPAPPYEIWNVEVRGPDDFGTDGLMSLLTPAGDQAADHLVGRSAFRAVEEPSVFIGFVAVTCRWLRDHPVPRRTACEGGAVAVWRRLPVIHRAEAVRGDLEGRPLGSLWRGAAAAGTPSSVCLSS